MEDADGFIKIRGKKGRKVKIPAAVDKFDLDPEMSSKQVEHSKVYHVQWVERKWGGEGFAIFFLK